MYASLGKFKQGDQVTIESMTPEEDDIKMVIKDDKGVTDEFFIDKNDTKEPNE